MAKQQRGTNPAPMSLGGLLGWLYDMSFTRHYAPQVIKAVYWLVTVFYSLVALVVVARLIQYGGPFRIVVGIIVVLVAYLLYLVVARIVLEVLIVFFRMGEDLRAIRAAGTPPGGGAAHPPSQPAQPYFMPTSPAGPAPRPAPAPPPFWAAAAVPPSPPSWDVPRDSPRHLGPFIEETAGYDEIGRAPATEAIPIPQAGPHPREEPPTPDQAAVPEAPAGGPRHGSPEEDDYPPEADGPPWIT